MIVFRQKFLVVLVRPCYQEELKKNFRNVNDTHLKWNDRQVTQRILKTEKRKRLYTKIRTALDFLFLTYQLCFIYGLISFRYRDQASKDADIIYRRAQQLLHQLGQPSSAITESQVKLFCRNASFINLVRGTSKFKAQIIQRN